VGDGGSLPHVRRSRGQSPRSRRPRSAVDLRLAGWLLFVGSLIFSGTVAAIAVGGPRWLGAITPLGGTLLIVGLLVFAWRMLQGPGTPAGF
jgi:uncharacterized membrane protein YgdD (TMEM256/DUF423 family)